MLSNGYKIVTKVPGYLNNGQKNIPGSSPTGNTRDLAPIWIFNEFEPHDTHTQTDARVNKWGW